MLQPRDRFGEIGGHFYEAGLAKTPRRRAQRIKRKRRTYVKKIRPAAKQPKRNAHPFLFLALFFELLALALILDMALKGEKLEKGNLYPMWLIIMGSSFFVLGKQKRKKSDRQ